MLNDLSLRYDTKVTHTNILQDINKNVRTNNCVCKSKNDYVNLLDKKVIFNKRMAIRLLLKDKWTNAIV